MLTEREGLDFLRHAVWVWERIPERAARHIAEFGPHEGHSVEESVKGHIEFLRSGVFRSEKAYLETKAYLESLGEPIRPLFVNSTCSAFGKGWDAFLSQKKNNFHESAPHFNDPSRKEWDRGWQEAEKYTKQEGK